MLRNMYLYAQKSGPNASGFNMIDEPLDLKKSTEQENEKWPRVYMNLST